MIKYNPRTENRNAKPENNDGEIVKATYLLFWATVGLVVVSGVLAVYTYRLYCVAAHDSETAEIRDRVTDSISAQNLDLAKRMADSSQVNTRRSLNISDELLRANREYTKVFADASEKQNRAYIVVIGDTAGFNTQNNIFQAGFHCENIGKTPASHFTHCSALIICPVNVPFPNNAFTEDSLIASRQPPDILGIGEKYELYITSNTVNQSTMNSIRNGKMSMYAYGIILYDDVFMKHHRTKYCMKFSYAYNAFQTFGKYNDVN